MRKILPAATIILLAACTPQKPVTTAAPVEKSIDQQILESAAKIQTAQAELYQYGAFDGKPAKFLLHPVIDEHNNVTVSWRGDAVQLLECFARDRNKRFVALGVKVSLPVNVEAKALPYDDTLKLIRAQIGFQATLDEDADSITLQYNPPKP